MSRATSTLTRAALRTGAAVAFIDRAAKTVKLADDSHQACDGLALCSDSRLRALPLPVDGAQGVYGLRSPNDAKGIAAALETARIVVVISGGFIELEVAAVPARKACKSPCWKQPTVSWRASWRRWRPSSAKTCTAAMASRWCWAPW